MYLQKVGNKQRHFEKKNLLFVGILSAADENSRIRIQIRKSVVRIRILKQMSPRIHNTVWNTELRIKI